MKNLMRSFVATSSVLITLLTGFCVVALAQQGSPGQNAVCTSSSGCSTTIGTSAFIDGRVAQTTAFTLL